jgi:acyl-CoA reductase-like NAD-dependent aldehyde dehydrogenase
MRIYQPYDHKFIAEVSVDDASSVEKMLDRAHEAFAQRSNWIPLHKRIEILKCIAYLVEEEQEQFAMLIAREGGKPLNDARVEVTRAINGIEIAIATMMRMAGEEIPMGLTSAAENRYAFTTKEPIGIVVAISAFNHPLNLIVHQVVPAIASGCPVIVKPAMTTPLTCIRFVELIREAGLSEAWCQTAIIKDKSVAEGLATDPRVAFLSFIGSARVGWHLRSKLAPGARCALEHGGSAPAIIDASADLNTVIQPLIKGGYYHAGQVCVSTQRVFVHDDIKKAFVDRFTDRVEQLKVGDPTKAATEVGPLIAPKEVDRVNLWVKQATEQSGVLTTGGKRVSDTTYSPTVIVDPSDSTLVSQQEIFGPVVSIYGYRELEDAVHRANSLPFAFQAAIFAQDINVALTGARLLDASAVMINDHTAFRTDWMPFAGRHQSGHGTGGIPSTIQDMTQDKMIVMKF